MLSSFVFSLPYDMCWRKFYITNNFSLHFEQRFESIMVNYSTKMYLIIDERNLVKTNVYAASENYFTQMFNIM